MLCLAAVASHAQDAFYHTTTYVEDPNSEPREHPVDMQNMRVEVNFEPFKGKVMGKVVHTFKVLQRAVDSISFDGVKIQVKQVLLNGRPARYVAKDEGIVVYCEPALTWDSTGTIQFTYEAKPRKGLFFVGWADTTGTMRRQIWTQGQATDNRHWIPMYDEMNDKMITETVVTFDSTYTVISNGIQQSVRTNGDGTKTWHYAMTKPHSSYLLMLAIGRYGVTRDTTSGQVALEQYWYPDRPQDAEPTYRYSRESMDFLEQEIGVPYAWGVYRQVPCADYVFGAMENTTATIFDDFYLNDARGWLDRSYVGVNVHELTHQWFGDLVTARSLKGLWLQESFATFYPLLFERKVHGEDEYQWGRRGMQNQALSAGEKDRYPIVHPKAGGSRVYPKGAVVLDMMRTTFGAEEQRRVLQHYLRHHSFGNVETNDLYQAFQDTLGLSPDWFFDQWLYRSGEPTFDVSITTGTRQDLKGTQGITTLVVRQTQQTDALTGYFRMPVVCEAHYKDGSKDSVRVWIDGPVTLVEIPNANQTDLNFVLFDPGSTILKRVNFTKSWDMLAAQCRKAPYMIDRYDALLELAKDTTHNAQLLGILKDVTAGERHQAMRSEAVNVAATLASKGLASAWELVGRGLEDRHVEVRKRTLTGMPIVPESLRAPVERLLEDSSFVVIEMALRKLCRSFPDHANGYLERVSGVTSAHALVEIAIAEIQAMAGAPGYLGKLGDYCSNRYPFWTRRYAFGAVTRVGNAPGGALSGMMDAMGSQNWRLADAARDALGKLITQNRCREAVRRLCATVTLDKDTRETIEAMVR
jgi:aminopeptidase N